MPFVPPGSYRKTRGIIRHDTRANQPVATDVLEGTLYYVTDEGVIERSDGTVWESWNILIHTSPLTIQGTSSSELRFRIPLTSGIDLIYDGTHFSIVNLDANGNIVFTIDVKDFVTIEGATNKILLDAILVLQNLDALQSVDNAGTGVFNLIKGNASDEVEINGPIRIMTGAGTVRQISPGAAALALYILGGLTTNSGASLQFYGETHASFPGDIYLVSGGSVASPNSILELAYRDSGGYKGRWRMDKNGKFGIAPGYANGGTVTQLTDKSTGVTLSKVTGEITMHNAALAADTTVSFVLTNTLIAAGDYIHVQHVSGGTVGSYLVVAVAAAGSATITVRNITTGSLGEAIVLKFFVMRATNS